VGYSIELKIVKNTAQSKLKDTQNKVNNNKPLLEQIAKYESGVADYRKNNDFIVELPDAKSLARYGNVKNRLSGRDRGKIENNKLILYRRTYISKENMKDIGELSKDYFEKEDKLKTLK
jgi:hypothetical protein